MKRALSVAALLASGVAHAEGTGIIVTGDAAAQAPLTAHLEGWLRDHGRPVTSGALPGDAVDSLIDCFAIDDPACAAAVVEARATSSSIVFVHLDVETVDGARTVTVTGHWLTKGRDVLTESRSCEACTSATLRATTDELIAALTARAPVSLALRPAAAPVPAPPPAPSRTVPYALIGGGAALLVTGIALVALAEDDTGDSFEYYDGRNRTAGLALGAIGLAAAGAGAYLYVRATRSPDSAPAVAVLPGGAYLGWAGAF